MKLRRIRRVISGTQKKASKYIRLDADTRTATILRNPLSCLEVEGGHHVRSRWTRRAEASALVMVMKLGYAPELYNLSADIETGRLQCVMAHQLWVLPLCWYTRNCSACFLSSAAAEGSCSEWQLPQSEPEGKEHRHSGADCCAKISRHPTLGASAFHIPQIPFALFSFALQLTTHSH